MSTRSPGAESTYHVPGTESRHRLNLGFPVTHAVCFPPESLLAKQLPDCPVPSLSYKLLSQQKLTSHPFSRFTLATSTANLIDPSSTEPQDIEQTREL